MKNLKILSAILLFSVFIFNSCTNKTAEMQVTIDELSAENEDLERLVSDLQTHLDESTDKYDQLSGQYQTLKNSTKPVYLCQFFCTVGWCFCTYRRTSWTGWNGKDI